MVGAVNAATDRTALSTQDASGAHATMDLMVRRAVAADEPRVRVIIQNDRQIRSALKGVFARAGGVVRREHALLSALTVTVPARALPGISRMPGVRSISIDARVSSGRPDLVPVTDDWTSGTVLQRALGLEGSAYTGAGVGIGVIDSGIQKSPDFGGRITAFYDFTSGDAATAPYDDYGHGTHVAGLAAGSGAMSNGLFTGVAPKASLIGLKVLGADGSGYTSDVIAALEFAVANGRALGIDILNLSLGHPPYEPASSDPLVQAVDRASAAGMVVIVSAGNVGIDPATGRAGFGGIASPGTSRSAITVGATNIAGTVRRADDTVGAYSSRGPTRFAGDIKPDVVAPGHRLVAPAAAGSVLAREYASRLVSLATVPAKYIRLSGTSMAAGVASGVAALVIEAHRRAPSMAVDPPSLTPLAMKTILEFTATRLRDEYHAEYGALVQGTGEINAAGAIALSRAIDTTVRVGRPWLTASLVPFTDFDGIEPWSERIHWNDRALFGDVAYWNTSAWDTAVLWGDIVLWGDSVSWGDVVLWGDALIGPRELNGDPVSVWGDAILWDGIRVAPAPWQHSQELEVMQ